MRKINICIAMALSTLSFQAIAGLPVTEANSFVKCEEAHTLATAVESLNDTVSSPEFMQRDSDGHTVHMKDYVSSTPTVTKLDNSVSVCVTLTKKSR